MTPRLEAVKNAVIPCHTLLDAGTDHAYIPIALVEQGICKKAIASDINQGPLQRAETHIAQRGLADRIETRLGSGITVLTPHEADTVVLAGMGGVLIAQLLQECPEVAASVKRFVLQPMNAPEYLRHWLHENGFCITREYLAREGEKIYVILCAEHGEEKYEQECFYYVGKALFSRYRGQSLLTDYLRQKERVFRTMLSGQRQAQAPDEEKIAFLTALLKELEELQDAF